MAKPKPNPIYTVGSQTATRGVVLDTINRNGYPHILIAAHAMGQFEDEDEYDAFKQHIVNLLNRAAGT